MSNIKYKQLLDFEKGEIVAYDCGLTIWVIINKLNHGKSTIGGDFIKKYKKTSIYTSKASSGRNRKTTDNEDDKVIRVVKRRHIGLQKK